MTDGRTESGGRLTTTIPRPKRRRASDAGRSRLGDIGRRRLPKAARIAPRRRSAWLFGLAALAIAIAIGAALFGLPVRTWFEQDRQLAGLDHELSELQTVNDDLEDEVKRLQTDGGMIEAARDELGYIQPGDNRETMHPLPPLPRDLPEGWPYSQVGQILAIREVQASAPAGTDPGRDGGGWVDAPAPTVPAATTTIATAPTATAAAGVTTTVAVTATASSAAAPSTTSTAP